MCTSLAPLSRILTVALLLLLPPSALASTSAARAIDTLLAQKRYDEAARHLSEALQASPRDFVLLEAQNRWALLSGDAEALAATLRQRSTTDLWATLQLALLTNTPLPLDAAWFASAPPDRFGAASEVRIRLALARGDHTAARTTLAELRRRLPAAPRTWLVAARVAHATGDEDPVPLLQHVVATSLRDPATPALEALAQLARGATVAARRARDRALYESPIHPLALRADIALQLHGKRAGDALATVERARRWWPGPTLVDLQARALLDLDRPTEARTELQQAYRQGPADHLALWCDVAWACRDSELLATAVAQLRVRNDRESIAYYSGLLAYLQQDSEGLERARERVEDAAHRTHLDELWKVRSDADRRSSGRARWGWYLGALMLAATIVALLYRVVGNQQRRGRGT